VRRLVPCFGILAACSSDPIHGITTHANPTAVHDTTGTNFGWHCDSKACVLSSDSSTDCAAGSKFIFFTERFVRICAGVPIGASFGADYGWCRPVACAATAECPVFDAAEYTCISGLCQREGIAMHRYDVEALCLSMHPRAGCTMLDAEVLRIEKLLDAACVSADGVCSVPAECPQP
jgi:hypothetical protein